MFSKEIPIKHKQLLRPLLLHSHLMSATRKSNARKPPYTAMVIATSTVLTLLGIYGVLIYQGQALLRELRESIVLVVEMRPNASEQEVKNFGDWLEKQAFAKTGSVRFVSKEAGAQILRDEFGDDFLRLELDNPLYNSYTVNLNEETVAANSLAEIRKSINDQDEVLDTYVQDELVATLAKRVNSVVFIGSGFGLLLLLGVIFLMINTTKLALLNKAGLIKNMELVGASWGFISKPFLVKSVQLGLLSGILACSLTALCTIYTKAWIPDIWKSIPFSTFALLAVVLLGIGVILNFASTYFVIRKTLKMRVNDLV